MSTGLDCGFIEPRPNQWYYEIEKYEERCEYNTHGPFPDFKTALNHLDTHYVNPGSYDVESYNEEFAWPDINVNNLNKRATL